MNQPNPHREALYLLHQGPILGRRNWVNSQGLLCTNAIYAKACLGWSNDKIAATPNLIADRMRLKYGTDVLTPLARILLDMFEDELRSSHVQVPTNVDIGNAGSIIVHLNDTLPSYSQTALEIAVEKAAIQWDERV